MHKKLTLPLLKRLLGICFFSALFPAASVHAVVINFDDLDYIPSDPVFDHFGDHPVTNEYLDQGLLIVDGYLAQWSDTNPDWVVSGPNYLLGGNSPSLIFVGDALPVFVSMYVTSVGQDAGYLHASGPHGWTEQQSTPGWGGPNETDPFEPRQLITFYSATGIQHIAMWSFQGSRVSLAIDDLTYEYAQVPAPATWLLFGLGICVMCLRHHAAHRRRSNK